MKRTPLKPGKQPQRRKGLNQLSKRTRARIPERQQCRAQVWERAGGRCEALAVLPHVCQAPYDVHEVVSRARGGSPYEPDNCLLLCRRIHDYVTTHPAHATALGLLKPSWERSA